MNIEDRPLSEAAEKGWSTYAGACRHELRALRAERDRLRNQQTILSEAIEIRDEAIAKSGAERDVLVEKVKILEAAEGGVEAERDRLAAELLDARTKLSYADQETSHLAARVKELERTEAMLRECNAESDAEEESQRKRAEALAAALGRAHAALETYEHTALSHHDPGQAARVRAQAAAVLADQLGKRAGEIWRAMEACARTLAMVSNGLAAREALAALDEARRG